MWRETNTGLYKKFEFKNFGEAIIFIGKVAEIAKKNNHHPTIKNTYNSVEIWYLTHDNGNKITTKDHQMAKLTDEIELVKHEKILKATTQKNIKAMLFADGGSRGNPGPSASGFVLYDSQDNELAKSGEYLGITTNNQAEYHALKLGIETALKLGIRELQVYMDSLLVINQMKGIFKVKNRDLWPIHQSIIELSSHFKSIYFSHVPRENNKVADSEVNKVLDAQADK